MSTFVPAPQVSWSLDGTTSARHGAVRVNLHGQCNWTQGHTNTTHALLLSGSCFASVAHCSSLLVGTGSVSVCARLRTTTSGSLLLSKLGSVNGAAGPSALSSSSIGFGLEIGDGFGVGVNLADMSGLSVHEEIGRVSLADGKWHHMCAVLDRSPPSHLAVYIDGHLSESLSLKRSRLRRLGSLDNTAPLLIGRRSWEEAGTQLNGAVCE